MFIHICLMYYIVVDKILSSYPETRKDQIKSTANY